MNDYLVQSYFDWLMDMIDFDDKVNLYETFLKYLFDKEYIWLNNIPLDENRLVEGLALRKTFAKNLSAPEQDIFINIIENKPCSILEMFIALADKLTQLVLLEKYEFFWMFIDNLGLNWATEYDFDLDIVDRIINDFMYGTVNGEEPNGKENPPVLFPCREVYSNMNLDLYMQANLYLKGYFI